MNNKRDYVVYIRGDGKLQDAHSAKDREQMIAELAKLRDQ